MQTLLDDLRSIEFLTGLLCGAGALAVSWRLATTGAGTAGREGPPPWGASLAVAALAGALLLDRVSLGAALALGGLAAVGLLRREWSRRLAIRLAAAGAAGCCLAFLGGLPAEPPIRLAAIPGLPLLGLLLGDIGGRVGRRTPLLLGLSAAGLYAGLPDTESVLILAGATLALLPLLPPKIGFALGPEALAAVYWWAGVVAAAGRPEALTGAVTCLGVLLVEPSAYRLGGRKLRSYPWALLFGLQALLVFIGSRMTARAPDPATAVWLGAATITLTGLLLVCFSLAAQRRTAAPL